MNIREERKVGEDVCTKEQIQEGGKEEGGKGKEG